MLNSVFDEEGKINSNMLKEYMDIYHNSTDISLVAIDNYGNTIISSGETPIICSYIASQNKDYICKCSHLNAARISEKLGEEYIFSCTTGLINFIVPLIFNKELKGGIIAGPVLLDYPDEVLVDSIINDRELPPNVKGKISSYLKAVPVVPSTRVRYLSKLLYILARNLMSKDNNVLDERKEKNYQQAKIGEIIQGIKSDKEVNNNYPYEKEKELMVKLKNGDVIGSKAILNDILGHIFFNTGGKIEVIKARTLELCTLLSRAAVEGGASLDKIFGLNYKFIGELSTINNLEELSYWTLRVLDRFGENILSIGSSKNSELIKNALNYINNNYMNSINLDIIAEYVHLNPSYFSTFFKKETGIGITDYLNKVRIDESKKLLKNMNNSILDVALSVGFEDQSYYSKVFKKITGKTPKQYKDSFN